MHILAKLAGLSFAICGLAGETSTAFADPTTQPTATQPAVARAPAATQPTPEAQLLNDIDAAYSKLASAQFDGTIIGRFDVRGEVHNYDAPFTSSFASPNKFRHETREDALIGSTGNSVYSYLGGRGQYQNFDAPKDRVISSKWPPAVTKILNDQNLSLLLVLSTSASSELKALSKEITLEQPTVIDGVAYPTLRFDMPMDHEIATVIVDPTTHLLRRVLFDYRKPVEKNGATDVKLALITIDYSKVIANAPVTAGQFAWAPPTGAVLASVSAPIMADDSPDAVKSMVGTAAPDFTLKKLDDKDLKLSDLKGSVVVLDFWATWCGPCVASLPHLDELYADESANGLKVIAINFQEDKETVQAFVTKKKWMLPVVLDLDGAVATKYKANALPETLVIGKDGIIKQAFVGIGHEDEIKAIVAKEMKITTGAAPPAGQ